MVLTVGLSGDPLAIAAVLGIMIYAGAYISGGHFNPAVSLAIWRLGKLSGDELTKYVSSQMLGGIVASILVSVFMAGSGTFLVAPAGTSLFLPFLAEALFTFALVWVVLNVAVPKQVVGNQYYGLAIGGIVLVGALSVSALSGGAFNPAVGVSPALVDIANLADNFGLIVLYITAPLIGGMIASELFAYISQMKE